MEPSSSRREFLATAAALPLAAASSSAVRLGGPIFLKTNDPVLQAKEHRRLGYSAAYCPANLKAGQTAEIDAARKAFAAENVVIAEVGAWVNMLESDPAKRRANRQFVLERLTLAEEIGALCCVDIGGSYNPKLWDGPDPKNLTDTYLDATVENCRYLIDAVKPKRTKFSIEMMGWALPNDPGSYIRLIKAVDRPAFGAHVDVCNIIDSPQRYYANKQVIEEVFRKLQPWIVSCHAKDVGPFATHFTEVIPGRGGIDYEAYLRGVAGLGRETPLMLEHLHTSTEYDEARQYIQKVAAGCGVQFA
ncbi:MAG TPA: TIM barrel protein [Bryobacteraceae bacterium]|nr:TIM barrel protein [Bryobacteraceae bacterium]